MRYLTIDTNISPIYAKNIDEFNDYVLKYKTENKIILTKSNNISQQTIRHLPASLVWKRGNRYEFHYIDGYQHIRVLWSVYNEAEDANPEISYHALYYFSGLLDVIPTDDAETAVDIFSCPENPVPNYYNYCNNRYKDMVIHDCYSLDRNSSFLASLVDIYPATKPWADKYMNDKINRTDKDTAEYKEFKSYDKIIVGWLNNPRMHRHNAWTRIIDNSNRRVHALRQQIEAAGHTVLVVNTDAVKFIGDVNYAEDRKTLGEFKYEWKNCDMYIKGVKSYAYKENGKWNYKQAGKCKLDNIKPREIWTLDDFKGGETYLIRKIIIENGLLKEIYDYETV